MHVHQNVSRKENGRGIDKAADFNHARSHRFENTEYSHRKLSCREQSITQCCLRTTQSHERVGKRDARRGDHFHKLSTCTVLPIPNKSPGVS